MRPEQQTPPVEMVRLPHDSLIGKEMISVGHLHPSEDVATNGAHLFERRAQDAVRTMRRFLQTPPSIPELAEEARVTPWHFIRLFHRTVGIPPGEYLAALRIDYAKQLLLGTPERVTDICFDLGFSSLGSFTSRFTALVGVSPVSFRRLADDFSSKKLENQLERQERWLRSPSEKGIRGVIKTPGPFSGPIFIGLFPKPIPERFPKASILLMGPGPFRIPHAAPEGFLMAAGIGSSHDPAAYLVPNECLLVGVLPLGEDSDQDRLEIHLRPPKPLDPPILVALLACLGRPDPIFA
ncbi:MAG: helix-turn-helix transcriptional regulator [Leptospirales bacterium]